MRKMGIAVKPSVLAVLILLAALPVSAGLADWQYQREITIQENSGETLHDYQVLVELDGSDFPGEAQPDGDDVRFTDADGAELSYWIEEFDAGSERAKIWVKVPEIPANVEAKITMLYGNLGAESESDGEAVFEFFDDFILPDGSFPTLSNWDITLEPHPLNNIIIEDNTMCINNVVYVSRQSISTQAKTKFRFGHNIIYEAKIKGRYDVDDSDCVIFGVFDNEENKLWISNGQKIRYWNQEVKDKYHIIREIPIQNWEVIKAEISNGVLKLYVSDDLLYSYNFDIQNAKFSHNADNLDNHWSKVDWARTRRYTSHKPTITIAPPALATHTTLTITKSPSPNSIRQFHETVITISIENSGTTDATDIEITDAIHPSFDHVSGDLPNPKRYDLISPGETRDLQYIISAKESGTFTFDPATVTYADGDGNIQEALSEPISIKVIPSTEGSSISGISNNPSVSTASVHLHGEKTDVVIGEDILLKLSAVNKITKPIMTLQVILIPPSGMSVTSADFVKSGAGQYTSTYTIEPGDGRDIEVGIRSNQVGDFVVNGEVIYYFGDEKDDAEEHTLSLPIKVRAEPNGPTPTPQPTESSPGFGLIAAFCMLSLIWYLRK